jgi:hypothetical protein
MADDAVSMSMAVGDAKSMAVVGDEPSILVNASRLVKVGEGAGESVDPDPRGLGRHRWFRPTRYGYGQSEGGRRLVLRSPL